MASALMSNTISVRGIRVNYDLAFPNNQTSKDNHGTIVLIHGFLCSTFTWQKCLQPLADLTGYQVLAYDRLGFGFTERVLDGELYTRKNEELLALELLNQLNIFNNVHLVSSSSGAVVAFDVAVARPNLIESIVFVAPYGLVNAQRAVGSIGRAFLGLKPVRAIMKFGLTHFVPFKNAYYDENIAKESTTREGYLRPIRDDPQFLKSFILFSQNYDPSSTTNEWHKLHNRLKILIISGEQDKIVSKENTQELYKTLKQSRPHESRTEFVSISQCGHLPQEEHADQLITLISQFITCQSTP